MLEYARWDTMHMLSQRQEKIERDRQRAAADKALRDTFAAAALTGLLASDQYDRLVVSADYADTAYELADAMLRERCRGGGDCPLPDNVHCAANHDAAPAARASVESVAPQPTTGDGAGNPPSHSGTGDTQEPVAWGVLTADGTAVLHTSCTKQGSMGYKRMMERQGEVVPLYRQAPDNAPPPPDNAAKAPDNAPPPPDNAEPFAWAIKVSDGAWSYTRMPHVARMWPQAEVVPLYRSPQPTLTDAEREDLAMWLAECLRQCSAATDGGNEELAERWQGRAKRTAAMLERLGGGR